MTASPTAFPSIAAQDAQPFDDGILGAERTPGVAVGAQGIGQRPGIMPICFVPLGCFRSR
jgi:hypothetical protein